MRDPYAERGVLSALFNYGTNAWIELSDFLIPDVFNNSIHQIIFECVKGVFSQHDDIANINFHTLMSVASTQGVEDVIQENITNDYISSIIGTPISIKEALALATKLYKICITTELQKRLKDTHQNLSLLTGEEPLEEILGVAEKVVFDYTQSVVNKSNEPQHIANDIVAYLDHASENAGKLIGIDSGFPRYNEAIGGGFRRKTVSLIGARTGVGKSYLASTIAKYVSRNYPVLYIDTEMCAEDHLPRMLAGMVEDITVSEIENGAFKDKNKECVYDAAQRLSQQSFKHVNVAGLPFEEIIGIIRRWVHKEVKMNLETGTTNDCLIIFDYVKLMSRESIRANLAEFQELGFLMTGLHNFSVKYDVPMLAFIQLNRDGINREETDVIAGSDRVLWLTTNFTIFKTKSDEEIANDGPNQGNRKLVVLKARHGTGNNTEYISVEFDGAYGVIKEISPEEMIVGDVSNIDE